MAKKLLENHEVKESGAYLMTRTDDDESGAELCSVVEFEGMFYLPEDLKNPIHCFDEECRWEKYIAPPQPASKETSDKAEQDAKQHTKDCYVLFHTELKVYYCFPEPFVPVKGICDFSAKLSEAALFSTQTSAMEAAKYNGLDNNAWQIIYVTAHTEYTN